MSSTWDKHFNDTFEAALVEAIAERSRVLSGFDRRVKLGDLSEVMIERLVRATKKHWRAVDEDQPVLPKQVIDALGFDDKNLSFVDKLLDRLEQESVASSGASPSIRHLIDQSRHGISADIKYGIRDEGEHYRIRFEGEVIFTPTKYVGMKYIVYLLLHPRKMHSALTLSTVVNAKGPTKKYSEAQKSDALDELQSSGTEDQEVADEKTITKLCDEEKRLDEEIREAEARNASAQELDKKRDARAQISHYLKTATRPSDKLEIKSFPRACYALWV